MENRLIIIRLIGGLGNQLFQLQRGLDLQQRIGGRLQVDDSFLASSSKVHEILAVEDLIEPLQRVRLDWIDLKLKRTVERVYYKLGLNAPQWINPAYLFENSIVNLSSMKRVIVDGFWQGADYLRESFVQVLRESLLPHQGKKVNSLCVCVHIRRGDYLTNKHWFVRQQVIVPESYYHEAFEHFRAELKAPRFDLYTDDEQWAMDTFGLVSDASIVPTRALQPLHLLARMASYRNFVIANSTLSWWAAVAASYEDKQVVMPRRWGDRIESNKYLCAGWIAL